MNTVTLTHKVALSLTHKQESYCQQACGVARFTYNWALAEWQRQYRNGEKPTAFTLKKQFNAIKKAQFPWMYQVTKYASQQPFLYLQKAFNHFFKKRAHYPTFKKRGIHDSFYIGNDHIQVDHKRIRLPHIGWVKMREALRFTGKLISATISRKANRWFVSLHVEIPAPQTDHENQGSVGVDLGIKNLATLSTGETFANPKPLRRHLKRLKQYQRRLSRKQKGSHNRHKARHKVAQLHYRITCIRQDVLHKLTHYLTQHFGVIAIEDLHVSGLLRNRHLARAISELGWFELRRQLQYKAKLTGSHLEIIDRFFPSSKRCSQCGQQKEHLDLNERVYHCNHCGMQMDRDVNAAINLNNTASSAEFQACGEVGAGCKKHLAVKPTSVKQELSRDQV
jgi:putative transposase